MCRTSGNVAFSAGSAGKMSDRTSFTGSFLPFCHKMVNFGFDSSTVLPGTDNKYRGLNWLYITNVGSSLTQICMYSIELAQPHV